MWARACHAARMFGTHAFAAPPAGEASRVTILA